MKKRIIIKGSMKDLTVNETAGITGGGEIRNFVRCVTGALTTGGGAIRTAILGFGLFGFARIAGVAMGCATE
jgi:hypothetical protein